MTTDLATTLNPSFPQIPGYKITEKLYLGSRTIVYRAIQTTPQRPVVIKLLRRPYPSFGELVQFRNQYTITKNLPIPGIVQPLSLDSFGSGYALVMEDYGAIALNQYIQQQPLKIIEVLGIGVQLADILHNLYENRVIHKDIKPANILIHPESKKITLIDFSIASLLPKETQEIQNPNILEGTLSYIAPEQTGRMNRGIDYRADFYAFGVTLYQLLTGKLPFHSDEPLELIHCHIAKNPISVEKINQNVPKTVADLVAKLMAKNAEDRYQSALGLKHDLELCLTQLKTTGKIVEFELGQRDLSDRFLIPEKLYGRETEVQQLLAAFDRVAEGASELMLVAGFSGIGKTAVVNEVHKPIVRHRGYFIQGKFDQFNRNIPLSAFVQALRDLMGQLLGESDIKIAQWKAQILSAVGDNGQVLIEVIPELEQIIGQQPSVAELSGRAAQNRFNLLFQKFISVLTTADHPLVIFLDDLQWADLASLQLIKLLMNDSQYLLMLGAYRDNEVSPVHPLIMTVDELTVNTITLTALTLEDTNHLVADTLNCSLELAFPLTELIARKTQGNPFFITQFLKALYEEGYICFNRNFRYWECDLTSINALSLTDDVVEFMAIQLQKLPRETQAILKLAACVGNQFDLETLTIISQQSQIETATALWAALQNGLILPMNQVYKFFQSQTPDPQTHQNSITSTYRFSHDRVQQAAYSLIAENDQAQTHYKIGQLLLQKIPEAAREERIFELVNQLNYGTSLISEQPKRDTLAGLNLMACRKAKASNAYQAGRAYAATGLTLLGQAAWSRQYQTRLAFGELAAELASLCGDIEAMEHHIETVIAQSHSLLEQVNVYCIRIQSKVTQSQLTEAIAVAQQFLEQFGVTFPESPTPDDIQQAVQEVAALIINREIEDLIDLPLMTDEEKKAIVKIANSIMPAASILSLPLFPLLVSLSVKLAIQFGNSPFAAVAYAYYGIFACNILNDVEMGVKFGHLARELVVQLEAQTVKAEVLVVVSFFLLHRKFHIQDTLPLLQEAATVALEVGNLQFFGYAVHQHGLHGLFCGQPLESFEQKTRAYHQELVQLNQSQSVAAHYCRIHWQPVLNLLGAVKSPSCLSGEVVQEAESLSQFEVTQNFYGLVYFYLYKLILCYLFGEIASAKHCEREVQKYLFSVEGVICEPEFYFWSSLVALAELSSETIEPQTDLWQRVEQNQAKLQQNWVTHAPMNYRHKWQLVEAEKYRVLGNKAEAIEYYDRAIAAAKENDYIQQEAIANELAAKFYLDWGFDPSRASGHRTAQPNGKEKIAQDYLIQAYYAYAHWGAKAKIQDLERRYPKLLTPILQQQQLSLLSKNTILSSTDTITRFQTDNTYTSTSSGGNICEILDLATVLKTSQTLSSEIQLDKLLATLLHTMLENAGADKAALLMPHQDQWFVEAVARVDQPVQVKSIALAETPEVPLGLVNRVKRSLKPIVIADAAIHPIGVTEAYIQENQPKSILCTPIFQQSKVVAILYLENQMTVGAFTCDRVNLLNILCAQAAISLENARLYVQEQEKSQQLQQSLAALKKSEAQFKHLFESSADAILLLDEGVFVDCNPATVEMMRCSDKSEFLSLHPAQLSPEFQPDGQSSFEKANQIIALAFEKGTHRFEWMHRRLDGEYFWVEVLLTVMPYQGKNILHTVWREIGDRKLAESQLRENELFLRSIYEGVSQGICVIDVTKSGNFQYVGWNPCLERITNFKYQDVFGKTPEQLFGESHGSILRNNYQRCLQLGTSMSYEEFLPFQGQDRWWLTTLNPLKNEANQIYRIVLTTVDITDRKVAENLIQQKNEALENTLTQLQQSQAQVVQAEKMSALGNLVAGVAHEINNPLGFLNGSINNATEYIQDLLEHLAIYQQYHPNIAKPVLEHADEIDLEFLSEDLPKLLQSMQGATERIKGISTSLRTFSRADTEHKIRANLHESLDSTLLILKYRLKASEYRPEIEVIQNYGNLPEINCFPGQLNQVFMNILANAIDAFDEVAQQSSFAELKDKSQTITIQTDITQEKAVEIRIRDNGKGMPEEVKNRIFEHLFTTKCVGKGTGLGLSIARQIIVEKHGGEIQVNSTPGQGTEFVILLPIFF